MARRFPARNPIRGRKRTSDWVGSADQGAIAVAGNTSVIIQSNALLGNTTVVRTRGQISAFSSTRSADTEVVGAFGICIVTDEAFAAGAASIPGPWTNSGSDRWFVWEPIGYLFEVTTDVGRLVFPSREFDSKAMRKVGANETVVVMYESQASAQSVFVSFRMLLKLA